jgi:hypothetical protein
VYRAGAATTVFAFEILAYWLCRLTNARTEGFNNKAKLVKRRAFGDVFDCSTPALDRPFEKTHRKA